MKRLLILLAACSVPDKHPSTTDGGMDAPLPVDDDAIPETTIVEAPTEFSNAGSATFKFTANYANATFECSIDGETPVVCSSPYTRVLPDGSHSFSVRALNKHGKGDATPAEHLWTVDTVAPTTQLTETPPPADNSVMVRFSFQSAEENVTFDCSLDGGSYSPCTTGAMFGPIADGSHSFAVRAHDRAGNVDASPAIHAWSVDTSTPDTQLISGPDGATASSSATFTFVSPDAGGGATFQCALDGGAMAACTSPHTINNLTMGDHTFQVRVRDAVGNFDPTPATRAWSVDLADPETSIESGPAGAMRIASATFTFSSNEMPVTFTCSLDGGAYAPCTSPHNLTNLGQGAHTFSVRATDAANHTDPTPATRAWSVDTIAPEVTFVSGPSENATTGPRAVFGFTASEGTIECSLDSGPFVACTSPYGLNGPEGAHAFRVRATDAAGNVTTATRNWTIACAAPTTAGAAGLLHLDDSGQVLANATGGANAVLGTNDMAEAVDPTFGTGRFGGGVVFNAAEGDRVAWPAALGASDFTIELWVRPDSLGGTRDVLLNGDGRLAIRVTTVSQTSVRIQSTVVETGGAGRTTSSGAVPANAWHHVIVSLGGGTLRQWVDGARQEIAVAGAAPAFDSVTLGMGYGGALDEVWVAQTPITDDETALGRWCPM